MKRPLVLGIALAVALSAAGACKKAEEAPAPADEKAAPAAPATPEAAAPEAKKPEAAAPAPGGEQAPAQPTPAPDKPET
jgi:hypothetical protein